MERKQQTIAPCARTTSQKQHAIIKDFFVCASAFDLLKMFG
jgi:hypothetical protein